ncbi:MAG: amidohydrolase family protein [Spirochaetaceae bacterium]|nr:amidohydrolase family protein [Spirochaetaceae bacterium]
MNNYEKLLEYAWSLDIVDTHEHLVREELWMNESGDIFSDWLKMYFSCDLISAGLSYKNLEIVRDPFSQKSITEKWNILEPYWHAARNTGYGRSLDLAAKGLYGINGINRDTIEELNNMFLTAKKETVEGRKSHYRYVLKEKSKISVSVQDTVNEVMKEAPDREFYRPVYRLDWFINPDSVHGIRKEGEKAGVSIHCLEDWKAVTEFHLDEVIKNFGIVAIKSGLAYERSLYYAKVPYHVADTHFCEILGGIHPRSVHITRIVMPKEFQDYMMHFILSLLEKRSMTIQFHTGLQEGSGNHISNSNPEHMTNLFLEYPGVNFDIFHIGFPYQQSLGVMAKNFPNVYIDMAWAHIISPETSIRAIVEWLDSVPANKICAFGGDYFFVDGVYGHVTLARENVAKALAVKVERGSFYIERAMEIMGWMFIDTPSKIFNL